MEPSPESRSAQARAVAGCPLCAQAGGALAWRGHGMRVVVPDEPDQPGVARVILDDHVAELSDLDDARRERLMAVVVAVERVLREALSPDKVNLAALGNMVPHLHWHVIPRWRDDARFPASPWSPPVADAARTQAAALRQSAAREAAKGLRAHLARTLPARVGGEGVPGDRIPGVGHVPRDAEGPLPGDAPPDAEVPPPGDAPGAPVR